MKKILVILLCLLVSVSAEAQQKKEVKRVVVTPTVDTAAYATKDDIGGLMTFTAATCTNNKVGKFVGIEILDRSNTANAVEYNVLIFRSAPAGTFTDQAAIAPADADLLLLEPIINIGSTDCAVFAVNGICTLSSLNSYARSDSTGIEVGVFYIALEAIGTPTYQSSNSLSVVTLFECN